NDCENGSDKPSICPQRQCTSTQFQCENQNCESIVCDEDCGRDDALTSRTFLNRYFKCSSDHCRSNTSRCD
ncbi:unnamed protein product, partial [Rotaria sp. Silwood2]